MLKPAIMITVEESFIAQLKDAFLPRIVFAVLVLFMSLEAPCGQKSLTFPSIPQTSCLDTESSTIVKQDFSKISALNIDISFPFSSTNNLEIAFGRDLNQDNRLELEETGVVLGWDSSCCFIENPVRWLRYEEPAEGGQLSFNVYYKTFAGNPVMFASTINGSAAFTNITEAVPGWMHSNDWNMMQATRRGIDASREWITCTITNNAFTVTIR